MRIPANILLAAAVLTAPLTLGQQALVCAGSPPAQCDAYHYHVQLYRPDSRQFVEISATNSYASEAACNRAREAHQKRSAAVSDFFRVTKEQRYEADRFGPCHCDQTGDKTSANFLAEPQRAMQQRLAEEVRLRVKERLLDEKITTDNALVRGLYADDAVTPQIAAPKFVPLPAAAPAPVLTSPEDLKATRTIDTSKPVIAALDLPIIDVTAPPPPPPAPPAAEVAAVPAPAAATDPAAPPAAAAPPAVNAAPPVNAPPRVTNAAPPAASAPPPEPITEAEQNVVAEPAPQVVSAPETETETVVEARTEEETLSAQEAAAAFIEYETERVMNVLKAGEVIADEALKAKIFQATSQRINLLSNLRVLIEGAGTRSRLATAAREAHSEDERLAVIAKLFGDDIRTHWAPRDAADVVFNVAAEIAAEPERALRDESGRYSARDKRHALYALLAQSQPTEEQRLWLTTVIEGFLQ